MPQSAPNAKRRYLREDFSSSAALVHHFKKTDFIHPLALSIIGHTTSYSLYSLVVKNEDIIIAAF